MISHAELTCVRNQFENIGAKYCYTHSCQKNSKLAASTSPSSAIFHVWSLYYFRAAGSV